MLRQPLPPFVQGLPLPLSWRPNKGLPSAMQRRTGQRYGINKESIFRARDCRISVRTLPRFLRFQSITNETGVSHSSIGLAYVKMTFRSMHWNASVLVNHRAFGAQVVGKKCGSPTSTWRTRGMRGASIAWEKSETTVPVSNQMC